MHQGARTHLVLSRLYTMKLIRTRSLRLRALYLAKSRLRTGVAPQSADTHTNSTQHTAHSTHAYSSARTQELGPEKGSNALDSAGPLLELGLQFHMHADGSQALMQPTAYTAPGPMA